MVGFKFQRKHQSLTEKTVGGCYGSLSPVHDYRMPFDRELVAFALSPNLICSTISAKVKFQSGPVVRAENCYWLLWVVHDR